MYCSSRLSFINLFLKGKFYFIVSCYVEDDEAFFCPFRCTIPSIVISLRFNKRGNESHFEFEEQLEKGVNLKINKSYKAKYN